MANRCCGHGHSHGGGNDQGHEKGGHGHSHGPSDASEAENSRGLDFNLYLKIDMDSVTCLNEAVEGSGKTVFRSFEQRFDRTKFVSSDVDEELLFNIPFTGLVKLKGMIVIGGERETHPDKMRLFKNRPSMSFDDARGKADQEIDVHVDNQGLVEYKPVFKSNWVKSDMSDMLEAKEDCYTNTELVSSFARDILKMGAEHLWTCPISSDDGVSTKVARFNDVHHLSIHFPSNHGNSDTTEVFYIGLKGDYMEAHRHEVTIAAYESRANPVDHKTDTLNQVNHMVS